VHVFVHSGSVVADKDVHCLRFWDPKLDPRSFAFIGGRLYARQSRR
jgi:hypothetical protein